MFGLQGKRVPNWLNKTCYAIRQEWFDFAPDLLLDGSWEEVSTEECLIAKLCKIGRIGF